MGMGHTHVCSGLTAGAGLLPVVNPLLDGPVEQIAWVACCGGLALLPDLDHVSALAAKTWGPVTELAAKVVCKLGRGHRGGTHDPVLAPLSAAAMAWVASWFYWSSIVAVALAIGLALRGLHFLIPGKAEKSWPINLAVSAGAAWLLVQASVGMPWLPIAFGVGVLAHLAGDWPTHGGLPKPLSWIREKKWSDTFGPRWWGVPARHENKAAWLLVGLAVLALWFFVDVPADLGESPRPVADLSSGR